MHRRTTSVMWLGLGTLSVVLTVMLAFGFGYAVYSIVNPLGADVRPPGDDPVQAGAGGKPVGGEENLALLALGDSLTKGTGDSTGLGYAGRVHERIRELMERPVQYFPYGVNGYTTADVLADLEERNILAVQAADLIVMTAGGNDLFDLQAFAQGKTEVDPAAALANVEQATRNLQKIFARLQELNGQASVHYIGLYNPFLDLPDREAAMAVSQIVQQFNSRAEQIALAFPNVVFVPIYDLFAVGAGELLSGDHFHPNEKGYERIAERVMQVVRLEWGIGDE